MQCDVPKQATPIALAALYSLAVVVLTAIVAVSSVNSRKNEKTIDELKSEVSQLRKILDSEGKAVHFLNEIKRRGVDVKSLVSDKDK